MANFTCFKLTIFSWNFRDSCCVTYGYYRPILATQKYVNSEKQLTDNKATKETMILLKFLESLINFEQGLQFSIVCEAELSIGNM